MSATAELLVFLRVRIISVAFATVVAVHTITACTVVQAVV